MDTVKTIPDATRPGHRKFSKPPVKVACLACRNLRIRCDGLKRCGNCVARETPCCYVPSKRGGPRIRKRKRALTPLSGSMDTSLNSRSTEEIEVDVLGMQGSDSGPPSQMSLPQEEEDEVWLGQLFTLGAPGAGLRSIESSVSEIEQIFDEIFAEDSVRIPSEVEAETEVVELDLLQVYASDEDILDAYYVFIHLYSPLLPPPERLPVRNKPVYSASTYRPSSPLALAVCAILALIPHPDVRQPSKAECVKLRRETAHSYAQAALEAVEADLELLDSASDPSRALSEEVAQCTREPFHAKVPVGLEAVLALVLLSSYEYAQRGNIQKMCNRAGQALTAAMSMSLHETVEEDGFAEARRRAWWMTYMTVCQGSIVSGMPPVINVYDPRFVTPYPKGWKLLIEAQQTILEATTFVHDLNLTIKSQYNAPWIAKRMMDLDSQITYLLHPCRASSPSIARFPPIPTDSPETIALQSMKYIAEIKLHSARIKTHRFCAFQDIAIFRRRHCDLHATSTSTSTSSGTSTTSTNTSSPTCCSLPLALPQAQAQPQPQPRRMSFPFSGHVSSKVCLHAALNITNLLDHLPYPNPSNEIPLTRPPYLSRQSRVEIPRTMPSFACCAMQASYAMMMLGVKARASAEGTGPGPGPGKSLEGFVEELRQNLRGVWKVLGNYAIAFEAVGGMRDEIGQSMGCLE
ncbi:putative C6 finger domain protein [Aspergillus homomorphus CBS 101889]|uniref:C6 zinc finger domain protein n=1 Tax=Aspergillus homomorphus (strain CBS 101889) TaxID=1450537 RepID=A0A395HK50_ASPHC|nr:C6 zinc finger domain protein [Aspergillus homomorphus CBS 101889]RAL07803.1 C6 zinc finger domain protein [Aspergillus homomorphus CBS 101889]